MQALPLYESSVLLHTIYEQNQWNGKCLGSVALMYFEVPMGKISLSSYPQLPHNFPFALCSSDCL